MAVQDYINKIIPQHRSQPKFIAWLTVILQMQQDARDFIESINAAFDIDNAVGVQLDILGQILGQPRLLNFQPSSGSSILTDDYYRLVLKAKILNNQWDGTREHYDSMLSTVFANLPIVISDNSNMTIGIAYIAGSSDAYIGELLSHGYLFPVSAGISASLVSVPTGTYGNLYYRGFTYGALASYTHAQLATGI